MKFFDKVLANHQEIFTKGCEIPIEMDMADWQEHLRRRSDIKAADSLIDDRVFKSLRDDFEANRTLLEENQDFFKVFLAILEQAVKNLDARGRGLNKDNTAVLTDIADNFAIDLPLKQTMRRVIARTTKANNPAIRRRKPKISQASSEPGRFQTTSEAIEAAAKSSQSDHTSSQF